MSLLSHCLLKKIQFNIEKKKHQNVQTFKQSIFLARSHYFIFARKLCEWWGRPLKILKTLNPEMLIGLLVSLFPHRKMRVKQYGHSPGKYRNLKLSPEKEGSTLQVILISQQIKGPMRPWGWLTPLPLGIAYSCWLQISTFWKLNFMFGWVECNIYVGFFSQHSIYLGFKNSLRMNRLSLYST